MSDEVGCPVTVWPNAQGQGYKNRGLPCGEPLAQDALFCAKHEEDRLRLGGV